MYRRPLIESNWAEENFFTWVLKVSLIVWILSRRKASHKLMVLSLAIVMIYC